MAGCCDHGNEPSVSIKCCEFLNYLRNCWLLKNVVRQAGSLVVVVMVETAEQ